MKKRLRYRCFPVNFATFLWVLGQLLPRKIAPNPKTNPNPKSSPDPNRRAIFLRGNCPDNIFENTYFVEHLQTAAF